MKLKSIYIHEDYGNVEKLKGTISIAGQNGDVQLNLTNEQADRLIRVVANELVETAREVAETLTAECIEYRDTPQISSEIV